MSVSVRTSNNRLKKAATLLRKVHRQKQDQKRRAKLKGTTTIAPEFNMEVWGRLFQPDVYEAKEDLSCLTSACAIGHIAPYFKRSGFKLVVDYNNYSEVKQQLIPEFDGLSSFAAVCAFFGISDKVCHYFFGPDAYKDEIGHERNPEPLEVAQRIESWLRQGRPERVSYYY